uniref:Trehalose 6-phosphate phosphatase n=1 Tax=Coccolithus braarudii TaxID=221442 RepID=A0A7S0L357_9EUKA|mmetsp:Transcript_17641/g.38050  ORF Transcript_17641/g.38050 Transcript_17641/m.38050 type:complete len:271 (+) Transcript_17641:32-844(+)
MLAAELPHALEGLEAIRRTAGERRLAFFLDYDGTLTPIVQNPDEAVISAHTREVLRRVCDSYSVSIVSGRSCEKLYDFLQLELNLAGSHGLDIRSPHGKRMLHPIGAKVRHALLEAKAQLDRELDDVPGYLTEDNVFCISAHYRRVPVEMHDRVHDTVMALLGGQSLLQHKSGKMVHELRPAVDWDKGKAVEWLLRERVQRQDEQVCPIYIGDDVSDEDAFKFVTSVGGIAVKVVEVAQLSTTKTSASHRVDDPCQVFAFLRAFLEQEAL